MRLSRSCILCVLLVVACAPTTETGAPPPQPTLGRAPTSAALPQFDLLDAIGQPAAGSVVGLAAGEYRVASKMAVATLVPFSPVGAGKDRTRIVSEGDSAVLIFAGDGVHGLEGISLVHRGTAAASIIMVVRGEARIIDCRFEGGVQRDGQGGNGLLFTELASGGLVRNTEFVDNGGYGIVIGGAAAPTVEGNTFERNGAGGILFQDDAGGQVLRNSVNQNLSGIDVTNGASPRLDGNRISGNRENGIRYFDTASGHAHDNVIFDNGYNGIFVADASAPRLTANTIRNNTLNGIVVRDSARPALEGNTVSSNLQDGIVWTGDAGGQAAGNVISENSRFGIHMNERAAPNLTDIRGNVDGAIEFYGSTGGVVSGNTCVGSAAIELWEQSAPTVGPNGCTVDDRRPASP